MNSLAHPSAPLGSPALRHMLFPLVLATTMLSGCQDLGSELDAPNAGAKGEGNSANAQLGPASPADGDSGASGGASGAPPPSSTTEVCDGVDNDGDGEIDEADAGCFDVRDCAVAAVFDPTVTNTTSSHAIWLPGINSHLQFQDDARFVENTDGTATLTGTLAPAGVYHYGFDVTVEFSGHTLTAPSGSPVKELLAAEYVPSGTIDPSSWHYYATFSGELTGLGDWEGATVKIVDSGMAAFQVGEGASGRNLDLGGSGWIDWTLVDKPDDGSICWDASGHGDINVNLGTCEDCIDVDLGAAADHNVFVFTKYKKGMDVEGRVAAGQLVEMSGFSVGRAIGSGPVLVSGERLVLSAGTVHGEGWYTTTASVASSVTFNGGDLFAGSVIDFPTEQAALEILSEDLGDLTATGRTEVTPWGEVTLTGSELGTNIFTVPSAVLGRTTSLTVDVPSGSLVVINVDAAILNFGNFGITLSGVDEDAVLWNFPSTAWLGLSGIGFRGSLLAPFAHVSFDNGNFDGNLIASSFTGSAEGHHAPFNNGNEACE